MTEPFFKAEDFNNVPTGPGGLGFAKQFRVSRESISYVLHGKMRRREKAFEALAKVPELEVGEG